MKSAPPPANFASSAVTLPHPANVWLRISSAQKEEGQCFHWPSYPLLPELPLFPLRHSSAVAALGIPHSSGHAVLHPPQTPSQPLGELLPRAPQARLQRVFRDPQLFGGFTRRKSLHFAQDKRRSQQRRKLVQVFADHLANLRARKNLLGIRPVVREALRSRQLLLARRFVQGNRRTRLRAPPPHQRRVDHDARQPRRKLRPPLKTIQIAIRREEPVLKRIFCVFRVPQHSQSGLKQRPLVTPEQRFHRLLVTSLSCADQLLFVRLYSHCRLSCHRSPQLNQNSCATSACGSPSLSGPVHHPPELSVFASTPAPESPRKKPRQAF